MSTATAAPRWRLDTIYPSLDSEAYRAARAEAGGLVDALESRLDEAGVRSADAPPDPERAAPLLEELIARFDEASTLLATLNAYLYGFVSTDAFDERAGTERSSLLPLSARLGTLSKRLGAWLRGQDLDALAARSDAVRERLYPLSREQRGAARLMGDEAEALAGALDPVAGGAWGRLHGDLVARRTTVVDLPGRGPEEHGLASLRNLQSDPSRDVRRAAWRAEATLLEHDEVAFAAAMNAIKGQVGELTRRRGWSTPLEASLFGSAVEPEALDAMHRACDAALPEFRRYLRAKARFLGLERLSWYDLLAPVAAGPARSFSWDEAVDFVVEAFGSYAPELADFARRAALGGWIDVPPARGKRNGAFCMAVPGRGESRILLNFGGTLDDVFTLAHELGHAWHNDRMVRAGRDAWRRGTPMTLAETASIFCETIVVNALLEEADDEERLAVLEQDLLGAAQLVIDIGSRFRFESAVFARRPDGELPAAALKALMREAQEATYGDALHPDERNDMMWAHKGHYYSSGISFYNYPYTFGYLFGLGLYAAYEADPDGFRDGYDALLADTGSADAGALAARFGIDAASGAFWRSSLAIPVARVAEYEALVDRFA